MRFVLPALSLLCSSCFFQSSTSGEKNLLGDLGISTQLPTDSLDLKDWTPSQFGSKIANTDFFRQDSSRALVIGDDTLGGVVASHKAYFRISVTDSTQSLLMSGDTAYMALKLDSLSSNNPVNLRVSWDLRKLDSLGGTASSAEKDTVQKIFFGADSLWYQTLAKRNQNTLWSVSENVLVQPGSDRWLKIPLSAKVLSAMRDQVKFRQVLDLKLENMGSSLAVTGLAATVDSAYTPRLLIGSAVRKINRFAEQLTWNGSLSSMVSNAPGDTLKMEFPIEPLRAALGQRNAWQAFGADSSRGPVVLGARLNLKGLDSLYNLMGEGVNLKVLYTLDSSSYLSKAVLLQEPQYDRSALLKKGAQAEVQLQIGSALAQALTQPSRVKALKLNLVLSSERKTDSTFYVRKQLALLKLKQALQADLHLIYSKQNGYYTKELK